MNHISKLSYKFSTDKTLNRHIQLYVDKLPLLNLIEQSIPTNLTINNWLEKNDAKIVLKGLKRSLKSSGEYEILTCAHCEMVEDLMIKKFKIIHEDDYIIWEIDPPGAEIYFYDYEAIKLKFHKPQIISTIEKLIRENEMN